MPITVYASGDGRYPALYDNSFSNITTKKSFWPGAFLGTVGEFVVRPVHDDGSPFTLAELSAYVSYDFGIDTDWNTGTPPPIRTITGFSIRETVENGVTWGEIVFEVDFDTVEAGELLTDKPFLEMGAELDGYLAGEDRAKLVVQFPFLLLGRRLASGTGTPTPVEDGSLSGPQIWALFANPGDYQFSVDGATNWHETQADADRYYRWTWDSENYGDAVKMPVSGPGDSAYQVWLDAGNSGTEQDFLDSLVGGDGEDGLSTYEVWLAAGNSGTEADFLAAMVGATGATGADGSDGTDGTDGVSSYSYIAFAADDQGTGWSLVPDISRPYIAFLVSNVQLTPVENDFAGVTWVKFVNTGDVVGPSSSTNNAIVRFDGTTGKLIQVSIVTITDVGKIGFPDISTTGFMNVAARSVAPTTPSTNDIYIDDGTNTGHGGIGLMQWNGASWLDFGGSVYSASQTYTDNAIDALVNGAGAALDTLYELAAALGNDPDFATTVSTNIAAKLAKNFSGLDTKTSFVDADTIAANDSANSGNPIVMTLLKVWNFIKGKADSSYLQITNNLSDINDAATARYNLGLDGFGKMIVYGGGYALDNDSPDRGTIGTNAISMEYADDGGSDAGATGQASVVLGGLWNKASDFCGIVVGGAGNYSTATHSVIGGGYANRAYADHVVIPGGQGLQGSSANITIIGRWNVDDTSGGASTLGAYVLIIGNGTSLSARSNALTLTWNGDLWVARSFEATEQSSAPSTPASSRRKLYPKADGWYDLDDEGNETKMGAGSGSGDVVGPSSSTNNAIARFDETTGKLIQDSVVVITDAGKVTLPNIAATGVLNITPRSTAPTAPATDDLYLDDGSNTTSGEKGWRQWNGSSWDDVGAIGGASGGASDADIIIISDFTASRI